MKRFILVAAATASCGGLAPTDNATSLIEQTTAGEQRCVSEGEEHKLFVVEWDATDASTFQARAARDVVFVHYDACEMRIVDGCSDGSVAGRYGTYRQPVMTSGATESFSIATKDELKTKLPLGALSLGAELSSDRALELSYRVSGTSLSSRDEHYRDELADNPRCKEVTHAVVAYNLGAFVLQTKDNKRANADAAVAGFGATGEHDQKRNTLREAGNLAKCDDVANHACRVPIRLTLRPVRPGAPPTATAPTVSGPPNLAGVQQSMLAIQLESQAMQKLMLHDGPGCLADLDKANAADPAGAPRRLQTRARCEMRAGNCATGKKLYRQSRRNWYRDHNPTGLASDATINGEVEQMAKQECATHGGKSLPNSTMDLVQKIGVADQNGDTKACIEHGRALLALSKGTERSRNMLAGAGLSRAATCAAKGGKCAEAKPLYVASLRFVNPDADAKFQESAWKINVKSCNP